jgi:hypothetical protein
MRENRTYGSEGGEPGNGSLPYPYRTECYVTDGMLRYGRNATLHNQVPYSFLPGLPLVQHYISP